MATQWQLTGDYFENCNCTVVCPCLVSTNAPLTSRPTEGECRVLLAFHIDKGNYGGVPLDGLNVALAVRSPGPMADGNLSAAAYIDERASDEQAAALGSIFTGAEGGPMAAFAPLITSNLGAKKVPIRYSLRDKFRSVDIPGIMQASVEPLPTLHGNAEMWGAFGHPIAPDRMALAVGRSGSSFDDYGMRWDNSGRNGHYAPISWSN